MTPQEIDTAISEYCDGKCCRQNEEGDWVWSGAGPRRFFAPYHDLNAMHCAEKSAGPAVIKAMRFYLCVMCSEMTAHHATSPQRAEAFLRAIGKWKE